MRQGSPLIRTGLGEALPGEGACRSRAVGSRCVRAKTAGVGYRPAVPGSAGAARAAAFRATGLAA